MTYKTHLSTGILFSSILFLLILDIELSPLVLLALVIATIIGSNAPDLDTPTGELWDHIPAGSILSRIVKPVFIGGHRHLSHSFIGLGLFTLLFFLLSRMIPLSTLLLNTEYLMLAFVVGILSHLFADMFTESGVPLFFPWDYHFGIPPDPLQKIRIKTGHRFENLVVYPFVNILIILVVYFYLKG